ncbi:MAG: YraN family protein [Gammaproteobacteria bacterium]|nr:YraN family protein [Gammaproteobacteria bacterium]NNJ84985.1 YraN family protein [Gammaproteobacteria bacterium]
MAAGYLCDKGMEMLAKNYRCKFGEIDLIMNQGTTIVFVEVRFRRNFRFGTGTESVDHRKKRRIVMVAQHYLRQHPLLRDKPCRFDIVSISLPHSLPNEESGIQWIPAAFDAHG